MQGFLNECKSSESSWCFLEPVPSSIKDYFTIVTDPIDLSLIQRRLDCNHYKRLDEFVADLQKMCDNCKLYNATDSDYYVAACNIEMMLRKLN